MRYILAIIIVLFTISCDEDLTLDETQLEQMTNQPNFELQLVSGFTVAQDNPTTIIETYALQYTGQLVSQIDQNIIGGSSSTFVIEYMLNNQIDFISENDNTGALIRTYTFSYDTDLIQVNITEAGLNDRFTTFRIDSNNRINRVESREIMGMSSSQLFQTTFNFGTDDNPDTIIGQGVQNDLQGNYAGEWDVHGKPFENMNQLLSHLLFLKFHPYGDNNPLMLSRPAAGPGNPAYEAEFTYTYNSGDVPDTIMIMEDDGITTTDFFINFEYITE